MTSKKTLENLNDLITHILSNVFPINDGEGYQVDIPKKLIPTVSGYTARIYLSPVILAYSDIFNKFGITCKNINNVRNMYYLGKPLYPEIK